MDYPIYENGRQQGVLNVSEDGLYTTFSAMLPARAGLYRLWLIGEDRNYCLGILEPSNGSRIINKRLSRESMKNIPRSIKYALATTGKAVFRLRKPAAAPAAKSSQKQSTELRWAASTMGCYVGSDALSRLVAIPTSIETDDPRLRLVNIKGCRYMVFRY